MNEELYKYIWKNYEFSEEDTAAIADNIESYLYEHVIPDMVEDHFQEV